MAIVVEPTVEPCLSAMGRICELVGRIRKLLGAAGFLAVIVEIIGPCKLRGWGESLSMWVDQWEEKIQALGCLIRLLPSSVIVGVYGTIFILTLIAVALSHNRLGFFIKGATAIILLVGLFLDLRSS
jgi:hypothetical protein